ncbi:hypothetical protein TL16_g03886 [Triparma laevis f. inornata]|uniref:ENTH domain-containing protein n=2 Tax=Triparma laevis TaxID=1534972 RepID=A0A9W7AKR0_9STRA|nr:hypothetical protein TL16_g03886 [Triparma laevis f. inornata]GMH72346.1 hypothetical protein TrLO_g1664 [Triparma laevis f. longispina]
MAFFANIATGVKHLGTKIAGTEVEKKVGAYIYDNDVTGATSYEFHNIAALTFGLGTQCDEVFKIIKEGMSVNDSTPLTIEKTLKLLKHLVIHGAERCVDKAWDHMETIEDLENYNTALLRGAVHTIIGGGVDKGEGVRIVAHELKELLSDDTRIREERKKNADPNALVPLGSKDDFVEPSKLEAEKQQKQKLKSNCDELGVVFGSVSQNTVIGAAYSLEDMMKKAAEQPERYFDDKRRMSGGVGVALKELDSQYTREKLAPDLLELDFGVGGGGGAGAAPPVHDIVAQQREEELRKELEKKDHQMKLLMQQQQLMMQQQQQQGMMGGMGQMRMGGMGGVGQGMQQQPQQMMQQMQQNFQMVQQMGGAQLTPQQMQYMMQMQAQQQQQQQMMMQQQQQQQMMQQQQQQQQMTMMQQQGGGMGGMGVNPPIQRQMAMNPQMMQSAMAMAGGGGGGGMGEPGGPQAPPPAAPPPPPPST